jgi:hypothetical protein
MFDLSPHPATKQTSVKATERALTDTNPVDDGFSLRHLSIANFLVVLANPNVVAPGTRGRADEPRQNRSDGTVQ